MSLRPMLYAADLGRLHTLLGSGNAALAARLLDDLRKRAEESGASAAEVEEVDKTIERAIHEPAPLKGLKVENANHVAAIDRLASEAKLGKRASMIHDGDWKHFAWTDYLDEAGPKMDKATRTLAGHLVNGRPLLGESMKSGWSYYAFLSNAEVRDLRDALAALGEEHPEIADEDFIDGFHNELVGWLDEVLNCKADLWLYAS